MVKQLSLAGMMKGQVEIVQEKGKRPVGRPPKVKSPEEEVEVKVKRPVGRPPKEKKELHEDEEKKLQQMVEMLKVMEDETGLVRVNTDEAGETGSVEVNTDAAGEQKKPSEDKMKSMLEKLSQGIHEFIKAMSPSKSEAPSLPIQDQDQNKKDEGTPKKRRVEFQIVQDAQDTPPPKTAQEIVEFCKESGKKGGEFGKLGGRPKVSKEAVLSSEEHIVQEQLGISTEVRSMRALKCRERNEDFGFQAKARFCELWEEAIKIVKDEEKAMSFFVKITGRSKPALKAALAGKETWTTQLQLSGLTTQGKNT